MTRDDYDFIIAHGWRAFMDRYLPQIVDLDEFDAHRAWVNANVRAVIAQFRARGFVILSTGGTTIPFEYFCGGRSLERFFFDLYEMPERVRAAMDVIMPDLIQIGLDDARRSGVPWVWVGGWRAVSAMLSPSMWETFVFPYYRELVTALAAQGVGAVLHFDHDWTRDLARLRDLPAKRCILNLDGMTDIRKAKALLGDHMAIMGDVPSALFANGAPEAVRAYVRDLVRDVGPTGLLLCPGCDAPLNARPENVEAFVAAGREFGVA